MVKKVAKETHELSFGSSAVIVRKREGLREVTCTGTRSQVAAAVYDFLQEQFQNWQYVNVLQQYVEMVQKSDNLFEVWVAPNKNELDTKLFAVTVIRVDEETKVREGEASPEMRERDIWTLVEGMGLVAITKHPDDPTEQPTVQAQPPNAEPDRERRKRGMNDDTRFKLKRLGEIRAKKIQNGKVNITWTNACQQVGIDTDTAREHAPELRAQWDNPNYHAEFAEQSEIPHHLFKNSRYSHQIQIWCEFFCEPKGGDTR